MTSMTNAHMWDDGGWGWMALMALVMLFFWIAVVVGIIWLVRGATRDWSARDGRRRSTPNALEILERRFAEGSITVEDYRARREVLQEDGSELIGLKGRDA